MTKIKQSDFAVDTATPLERPKSRAEKIEEYRKAHYAEYRKACDNAQCTCTPTRAEMLIIQRYEQPPID